MAQPTSFDQGTVTPVPVPVPAGLGGAVTQDGQMPIDLALSAMPVLPTKRKRDDEIQGKDGEEESHIVDKTDLIRAYFEVIKRSDNQKLLQAPLPESEIETSDEPALKRQRSEVPSTPPSSIADKVFRDEYKTLEELCKDVKLLVDACTRELKATLSKEPSPVKCKALADVTSLKDAVFTYIRREYAYPELPELPTATTDEPTKTRTVLTASVNGTVKQLFSSLAKDSDFDYNEKLSASSFRKQGLPEGLSTTQIHEFGAAGEEKRPGLLGNIFARPKKFIPLPLPQKVPSVRGNQLLPYEADPFDGVPLTSSYYFTQNLAAGKFLNYAKTGHVLTNASETTKMGAPEDKDVDAMERLFQSAFSSFAPVRDDSTAIVTANQVSQLWWQRYGVEEYNHMVDKYEQTDKEPIDEEPIDEELMDKELMDEDKEEADVDIEAMEKALEAWDETMIDPSLMSNLEPRPKADTVTDENVEQLLDEVSEMIVTLASWQRIRNINTFTPAEFQAPDALVHIEERLPTVEEMEAYEALKEQLALIISTLPPYAVAKLNSDQLEDLSVNTKIRIPVESVKGVFEEDEVGIRARQMAASQPASVPVHHTPARGGNSRSSVAFPSQYAATPTYTTSRGSVAPQNQYYGGRPPVPQTPVPVPRQGMTMQHVPSPAPQHRMPMSPAPAPAQHQPPPPQGYRQQQPPSNFSPYMSQLAKSQTPYGHQAMPQNYNSAQRPPPQPTGYPQGSPDTRYRQPSYQQGYQQQIPPQQPQYYQNGVSSRTASPQVPPPHGQQFPSGQFPQQRFNGAPGSLMQAGSPQVSRGYVMQPQHVPPPHHPGRPMPSPSPGPAPGTPNVANVPSPMGYHPGVPLEQPQQQMYQQAKARSMSGTPQPIAANGGKMGSRSGSATPSGRNNGTPIIPLKVTPVPVPVIPGVTGVAPKQ